MKIEKTTIPRNIKNRIIENHQLYSDDDFHRHGMSFSSNDRDRIFRMCELLRDMGIPFLTHRTGGADFFLEHFRKKGFVHGTFTRFKNLGLDWDENAPFIIEDF